MKLIYLLPVLIAIIAVLVAAGCCRRGADAGMEPESAVPVATTNLPLGIIGETEVIHLPEFSTPFEARIDTGATTSSIDAREIRTFERDGKKWVSFVVVARSGKKTHKYELPVARIVRIKRHDAESLERISVMMTFRIGHLTLEREFTLSDRAKFQYPVLIGRNVINGLAAVDPSQRNVL